MEDPDLFKEMEKVILLEYGYIHNGGNTIFSSFYQKDARVVYRSCVYPDKWLTIPQYSNEYLTFEEVLDILKRGE